MRHDKQSKNWIPGSALRAARNDERE